jgi:hypothetical protein
VTIYTGLDGFWNLGNDLITYLTPYFAQTIGGAIGSVRLVPGEPAIDSCECSGELTLSVHEMYLANQFPHVSVTRNPVELDYCRASWAIADYALQVVRCAPQPKDLETAVPDSELVSAARIYLNDAWVMLNVPGCFFQGLKDQLAIVDYSISNLTALGPEGACVGSTIGFSVALDRGESL